LITVFIRSIGLRLRELTVVEGCWSPGRDERTTMTSRVALKHGSERKKPMILYDMEGEKYV